MAAEVLSDARAVLDVSTRGVECLTQLCARWNHAPGELLSLRNELEDFRVVLDRARCAEAAIEAASQLDAPLATALVDQVRNADEHVKAMIEVLDPLVSHKKFKKEYGCIRQEGRVEALKGQIRSAREGINSLLIAHDIVKSTRVELDILSMVTVGPQRHQAATSTPDAPVMDIPEDRDEFATLDELQKSPPVTATGAAESQPTETSLPDPSIEATEILQALVSQIEMGLDRVVMAGHDGGDLGPGPQLQPSQIVEFTVARRHSSPPGCTSTSSRGNLPQILRFIVGSVFLGHTGFPVSFAQSHPDPKTTREGSIRFTYSFPIWYLQYCGFIYLNKITSSGPKLVLEPKNRVPWNDNPMFGACYWGKFEEVKRLYRESPWLARDLREDYGSNALFWAVRQCNVDIVKFLLAADAGTDNVGDDGYSATSWFASRNISPQKKLTPAKAEMYQLLGVREYIDEIYLPEMTRSILGLPGSLPLKDLVRDFPERSASEAKMEHDEVGNTVLHWACDQGDGEAVDLLVKLGADINAISRDGFSPLDKAATNKKTPADCINALFRAGAVVGENGYRNTPLHTASSSGTAEAVQALIDHGLSTEDVGHSGRTPLMHAALNNNLSAFKCLVENGAKTDCTDRHGRSPLNYCVWLNAHECIEELLLRGTLANTVDDMGHGILHTVAVGGDVETLKLFTKHGIPGIDIASGDNNYWVAKQYFKARDDVTKELQEAFDRLLDALLVAADKAKDPVRDEKVAQTAQ